MAAKYQDYFIFKLHASHWLTVNCHPFIAYSDVHAFVLFNIQMQVLRKNESQQFNSQNFSDAFCLFFSNNFVTVRKDTITHLVGKGAHASFS